MFLDRIFVLYPNMKWSWEVILLIAAGDQDGRKNVIKWRYLHPQSSYDKDLFGFGLAFKIHIKNVQDLEPWARISRHVLTVFLSISSGNEQGISQKARHFVRSVFRALFDSDFYYFPRVEHPFYSVRSHYKVARSCRLKWQILDLKWLPLLWDYDFTLNLSLVNLNLTSTQATRSPSPANTLTWCDVAETWERKLDLLTLTSLNLTLSL